MSCIFHVHFTIVYTFPPCWLNSVICYLGKCVLVYVPLPIAGAITNVQMQDVQLGNM